MDEKPTINLGVTLYDLNKQAMSKEEPLDVIAFNIKVAEMVKELANKKYWMLLNKERTDFSLFVIEHPDKIRKFIEDLSVTLTNRGQIISIAKQEDGNYEIWIRDYNTREDFAYYLFDYTFGIITI